MYRMLYMPILFYITSCSMKQFYPTAGALVGGGVGSLAGPIGAGLGGAGGALVGEVARGNEEIEEAKETITALSHGDVEALVAKGMSRQNGLFESFTSGIKKLLVIVGVILVAYLFIPVFVARKCSKQEAIKLTKAPFPIRPSSNEKL
jgi:hypothetical protein